MHSLILHESIEWLLFGTGSVIVGFVVRKLWKHRKLIASVSRGVIREAVKSDPRYGNGSIHETLHGIKQDLGQLMVGHITINRVLADHGDRITAGTEKVDALHIRLDTIAQAFAKHLDDSAPLADSLKEIIAERESDIERGLGRLQQRTKTVMPEEE